MDVDDDNIFTLDVIYIWQMGNSVIFPILRVTSLALKQSYFWVCLSARDATRRVKVNPLYAPVNNYDTTDKTASLYWDGPQE